jgi:beta-barrel assembly-enhancing protease
MIMDDTRRAFLLGASCVCSGVAGFPATSMAAIDPAKMTADLAPGFRPGDKDEKGFWQQVDEVENELKRSNFVIRDAALNKYITDLCCSLAGTFCPDIRVYIVRTPYFNASMYPTGMMQVWSGLLLRMKSEAQLATVLGHEIGHYLRRHMIAQYRSIRSKTSAYSFLAAPLAIATGGLGNLVAEMALVSSIYGFSREHEREADAFGLKLMSDQSLDPRAASTVWQQLIAERDATFKARGRKKPQEPILFATHPAPADRMVDLAAAAEAMVKTGKKYNDGRERYAAIIRPWRGQFLADQIKLNDFGGSLYLIDSLTGDGWDGEIFYQKGDLYRIRNGAGDLEAALGWYDKALLQPDVPAETWRSKGTALIKLKKMDEGKTALRKYLELRPDAPDRQMIDFNLQ